MASKFKYCLKTSGGRTLSCHRTKRAATAALKRVRYPHHHRRVVKIKK